MGTSKRKGFIFYRHSNPGFSIVSGLGRFKYVSTSPFKAAFKADKPIIEDEFKGETKHFTPASMF